MAKRKTKLPVTRTLEYLQARGWAAGRVDRQAGKVSFDYLGVADVLGIGPAGALLAVQCTSASNVSARVRKLEGEDLLDSMSALRRANIAVQVWGWYPDRDTPRIVDLS
ncbi:MAG: hypothetical protein KDK05_10375 [Candidatus Competibacteraceae bacterium]|nr:hypothetical protein [Candidatus Competibacteraceae bacterium]